MTINWKQRIITTAIAVAVVYAIEYVLALLAGEPFQKPSTAALIAVIVAVNIGNVKRK